VWKSAVEGRRLTFRLAGINNQNFIMEDAETGTWWQQITGCGIAGPLAGRCLEEMAWDEVTLAVLKREHPEALVLRPAEEHREEYAPADWEGEIARYPTPAPADPADALAPRTLVVGVAAGGEAAAYPWTTLALVGAVADTVGGAPILVVLHPDGRSLRCFDRRVDGAALDLGVVAGTEAPVMTDRKTRSVWDFTGHAVSGPLAGRRLGRVTCLKDYWFDWKAYNPRTRVLAVDPLVVFASP
jgi:hypothetical protein